MTLFFIRAMFAVILFELPMSWFCGAAFAATYVSLNQSQDLNEALKNAISAGKGILIDKRCVVETNVVVPETVPLKFSDKGGFVLKKGVTLTIDSKIEASVTRIKEGEGVLRLGRKNDIVFPEWVENGDTEDQSVPLNEAIGLTGSNFSTIVLSRSHYKLKNPIFLLSNRRLVSNINSTFSNSVPIPYIFSCDSNKPCSNITINGVTIDGKFNPTAVRFNSRKNNNISVYNNKIANCYYGILIGNFDNVKISDNLFSNIAYSALEGFDGNNMQIQKNNFTNVLNAIIIVAKSGTTKNTQINGNKFGGSIGNYPIHFGNSKEINKISHEKISINNNTIIGNSKEWNKSGSGGTADMISLFYCRNFTIRNNLCRDGGDLGISINKSENGIVSDNNIDSLRHAGILIAGGSNIAISNNRLTNNFQGEGIDIGEFKDVRAEVVIYDVLNANVSKIGLINNKYTDTNANNKNRYLILYNNRRKSHGTYSFDNEKEAMDKINE